MRGEPWRDLLRWYRREKRDLPWRGSRDPYRIWVSEIMLQQTRVEAVRGYYSRFLERFPDVSALAAASEAELLESWSGLGYYRRARMLHAAAQSMAKAGGFPSTHDEILALPGVGAYTAAAVASIAFELPYAVLDGNVARVAARLQCNWGEVSRPAVRRELHGLVQSWMDQTAPGERGDLNQALMELGATVCVPKNPSCLLCPVAEYCEARKEGAQEQLPVKKPKAALEHLYLTVALVRRGESWLMRQRPESEAIMPGFWELPQSSSPLFDPDCLAPIGIELGEKLGEFRHAITTRDYRGQAFCGRLRGEKDPQYSWVSAKRLGKLPFTTISRKAFVSADKL